MMGSVDDGFIAWGKMGGPAGVAIIKPFDCADMSVGNGSIVALEAKDEAHVKRIYDLALSLGGTLKARRACVEEAFTPPISATLTGISSTLFVWARLRVKRRLKYVHICTDYFS